MVVVGVAIQDKPQAAQKFISDFRLTFPNAQDVTGTVSVELERTPEPSRMLEVVEEAYRETARILAELGAREAATWQPVPST